MLIPSVMFIEAALDSLGDTATQDHELHEFRALGDARLAKLHDALPHYTDLEQGYLLGLTTARVILSTMPAAISAGVEL